MSHSTISKRLKIKFPNLQRSFFYFCLPALAAEVMVISRNELVEVESAIRSVSQQLYALLNKHALNDILNEKFVKLEVFKEGQLLHKIKQKSKPVKNAILSI